MEAEDKVCDHHRTLREGVALAPRCPPGCPSCSPSPGPGQPALGTRAHTPPREMTEPAARANLGSGHCASWPCHSTSSASSVPSFLKPPWRGCGWAGWIEASWGGAGGLVGSLPAEKVLGLWEESVIWTVGGLGLGLRTGKVGDG